MKRAASLSFQFTFIHHPTQLPYCSMYFNSESDDAENGGGSSLRDTEACYMSFFPSAPAKSPIYSFPVLTSVTRNFLLLSRFIWKQKSIPNETKTARFVPFLTSVWVKAFDSKKQKKTDPTTTPFLPPRTQFFSILLIVQVIF